MIPDNLRALRTRVASVLRNRPECFVTHPLELAILSQLATEQLQEFAVNNGWRVVRRLGGRQIEFYNDAGAREQSPG